MSTTQPDGIAAIRCDELTKRFGKFVALDRLTLDVMPGEVFGYLGPNGAGKSTTLRLLLGLIRPSSGRASVLGIDVAEVKAAHRHLAYVPGDVSLWPRLTGAECLDFLARLRGEIDQGFRNELVERFRLDVSKRARAYSKGNRQKVALVAAFAARPRLLLLDEPTSGLDPLMEQEFHHCVREAAEAGQTVFLSSHSLSQVQQLCTRVGILRDGVLVEVAAIEKLQAMRSTRLELDFPGPRPDLRAVDGVSAVTSTPTGVTVELSGSPAAVLRRASDAGVTAIRTREASLEEIFLTYYGDGGSTASTSSATAASGR